MQEVLLNTRIVISDSEFNEQQYTLIELIELLKIIYSEGHICRHYKKKSALYFLSKEKHILLYPQDSWHRQF